MVFPLCMSSVHLCNNKLLLLRVQNTIIIWKSRLSIDRSWYSMVLILLFSHPMKPRQIDQNYYVNLVGTLNGE